MSGTQHEVLAVARQIETQLGLQDSVLVQQLALVSQTVEQARQHAGLPDPSGQREKWREMYSAQSQRLYFADTQSSVTSWDPPPAVRFADWRLDVTTYSIDILTARRIFEAVHRLQGDNTGGSWRQPVRTLTKVLSNIVDCGNRDQKYRQLPLSNDKVRATLWNVAAARQLLEAVGFRETNEVLRLADDANLAPLNAALARLRRVADNKGHSGEAEFFPVPSGNSSSSREAVNASPLLGTPGYRYQERVFHCSACNHGINDGSERLFTGLHAAPKGEFRYECTSCPAGFNLCERCWDRLQSGELVHDATHNWQHHHPRTQRHNTQQSGATSGSNPWGMASGAGASASRALARMHARHGIHSPS